MAPPSKTVPHPGRALAALVALIVIMLLGVLGSNLFSPGQWHKDFKIGLGLDLSSGTQLSMKATTFSGGQPTSGELQEAIPIILARVNGTGNTGAEVQTEGSDILNVSVPGKNVQQTANLVSETALLMFRQTLLFLPYGTTTTPVPSASASASASASPSVSHSSTASPAASANPSATPSATGTAKTTAKIIAAASASPAASTSPSASGTASPTPSASGTATATASPSPSATSSVLSSSEALGDPSLVNAKTLALFNKLVCKPNDTQAWKSQVGYTNAEAYDNPNVQIVSCDSSGNKYALDVAKVQGTQISNATAELSTTSNEWEVLLTLKSQGASQYGTLTSDLYNKYYTAGDDNEETSDFWLDTIAIVLDGNVVTAPEVVSPIPGGNSQITGDFTQAQATQLQNVLKYGALPLNFQILSEDSVSAQLGRAQLDGGLIAAAIGLVLVVAYSFLYYRGLGIVSVSSLVIAGTLALLSVILLSKYQNFTLELAGIAGLIVAIGITADSFVVFFERLRDEVREGKQLRPAVEAGWKRARRTILVSDTVSFLAALLLYYFSIGEVKGFAYTLGLTTIIDVVVVFLFTKPMVTVLARTEFFGGGHPMSGLDPARLGARAPWRSSVRRDAVRRTPGVTRNTSSRNNGEA
ncbi:MAG TPA: protein translocase subunit SecD [Streptosporangiaceae bacterium]|nr:protein translocase subunit SecD [Streptosporangiaceae bacterium]